MALAFRTLYMNCQCLRHITKPVKWWNLEKQYPVRVLASGVCYSTNHVYKPLKANEVSLTKTSLKRYSTQNCPPTPEPPKQGLLQRLKVMYRDYWYVVVPVHIATSAVWFGTFYYTVRSGVDVLAILESIGVSESILTTLKNSGAGYFALAFALYKLATPLRYAVTLGGTTFAIRRLTTMGLIKPVPSKERLKELYQEKKDTFKDSCQPYRDQMQQKGNRVLDEMRRYKQDIKNRVKKM
ncbi:protein FAM210A [Pectinophora gossypiella]|nr:protein FAM210A [Pectinophora gossypiella]